MSYCANGHECPPMQKFCTSCGAAVKSDMAVAPARQTQEQPSAANVYAAPVKAPQKSKAPLIAALAALGLVGVVAGISISTGGLFGVTRRAVLSEVTATVSEVAVTVAEDVMDSAADVASTLPRDENTDVPIEAVANPSVPKSATSPQPQIQPEAADEIATVLDSKCADLTAAQAFAVFELADVLDLDLSNAEYADYDNCAALSWVIVPIDGGSIARPFVLALFHHGEAAGLASVAPFYPDVQRISDNSIQVTYTYDYPGEAHSNASGRAISIFDWNDETGTIIRTGDMPPRCDMVRCYEQTNDYLGGYDFLEPDAVTASPTPPAAAGAVLPNGGTQPTVAAHVTIASNLRATPACNGARVARIPKGSAVTVTGAETDGWYPISYAGVAGWISGKLIVGEGVGHTRDLCANS